MPPRNTHACCARGCTVLVPNRLLMCPQHWRMVPRDIQRRVLAHYKPGQSLATASTLWFEAAKDAIRSIPR